MAKSISVAVGDSDTMRRGRDAVATDVDRLADAADPPAMPDSSVSNTVTAAPTRATGVDARDARRGEEDICTHPSWIELVKASQPVSWLPDQCSLRLPRP
jgi:hypothetical protein